jgi:hypothetical protein
MGSSADSRRCSAVTAAGQPCRAWAAAGSEPPLCAAHRGKTGAPPGNKNRLAHGLYAAPAEPGLTTIDDVVEDALRKQSRLSEFIEAHLAGGEMGVEELAKLLALHGQNASRIGRLLRDRQALSGQSTDDIMSAIGAALDELSAELGIEL